MGNFRLNEVAERSAGGLKAKNGASADFLQSDSLKCMRTSCGSAICVNVNPNKQLDGSTIPFQSGTFQRGMSEVSSRIPAFGMADALLPGERCYSLQNDSLINEFVTKSSSELGFTSNILNDRVLLCGVHKPAAMRAPIHALKEVASLGTDLRGLFQ